MNKSSMRPSQLAVMIAFAISCVLLLLFLWTSFGGPVPLKAKPYQVTVEFRQGAQLASFADVRVSGVTVGKASKIERNGKTVRATLAIQPKYAPLPRDVRATLRSKTVVGETFIALSYGTRTGPPIPDGGSVASSNVQDAVELDGVLDVFDPKTRPRFKRMIASFSKALRGRGPDLNAGLGEVAPTLGAAEPVLRVLDRESASLSSGVRDLGTTFEAVGAQTAATRQLLQSGRRVVASTASVDRALRETVRQLPGTLRQTTTTLRTARATADDADPAIRALMPVAPLVKPALQNLDALAPDLRSSLRRLTPTLKLAGSGLPALADTFDAVDPLVESLEPVTDDALPMVRYLDLYKRELGISFANTAAATQATGDSIDGKPRHFVRLSPPINSETIGGLTRRPPTSRINAYPLPGGYDDLAKGTMKSADCSNVTNAPVTFSVLDLGSLPCITQGPLTFDSRTSLFPEIRPESHVPGGIKVGAKP